jgi:hypothetical protein
MVSEYEPSPPEILWKYREWNEYAERMIEDSEVYFSTLEKLNDPLDCHWNEILPTDRMERFSFIKELCNQTFPDEHCSVRGERIAILIRQLIDATKDSPSGLVRTMSAYSEGVFCASEINNNFLMWSHYADHHKGICVGIRPDRFDKRFLKCRYFDDAPVVSAWGYVRNKRDAFVDAVRCKSSCWAYELEWRTASKHGAVQYPGCVDSVVLGVRVSDTVRAEVLEAVERAKYPIRVLQAKLHPTKYELLIANLDGRAD